MGGAIADGAGILLDVAALALPGVSAGAGAGLKSARIASKVDDVTDVARNADSVEDVFSTKQLQAYYPPNKGFSMGSGTKTTLKPGTLFDRYGYPGGKYGAPLGTPIEARALPPGTKSKPYFVYEVIGEIDVINGPAASYYGQLGGGTQYYFTNSIESLIDANLIKGVK